MNQLTDRDGKIIPLRSMEDWTARKAKAERAMIEVMGPLPDRDRSEPPQSRVIEERDLGSFLHRFIAYRSEEKASVPASLYLPKTALMEGTPRAAILCCHGACFHEGRYSLAKNQGGVQEGFAIELAQRGYVVLAPAYPMQGDYFPQLEKLGYSSGSMKAIWDNIRAVDLLCSLPWVDPDRIGILGMSQGGYNTAFTLAFEPRLKVGVISVGFDSFEVYQDGDLSCWGESRHMPKILDYSPSTVPFDFHDVIARIAPRPCFISSPTQDFFKVDSAKAIVDAARGVYDLLGAPEAIVQEHPECAHQFPEDSRQRAYAFLDEHLGHSPTNDHLLTQHHVDAFAESPFQGNPAAVVPLKQWLPEETMQSIAMENQLSETAFTVPIEEGYEIRWFTPTHEVELCGHATLAAAFVHFTSSDIDAEVLNFKTLHRGSLSAHKKHGTIELNFPPTQIHECEPIPNLEEALGTTIQMVYRTQDDVMVLLNEEAQLLDLNPDMGRLKSIDTRGILVTAKGVEVDFVSRFFAPRYGIDEDPVTGSAHCALVPYWAERLSKTTLSARQLSPRGGSLDCRLEEDRVILAGKARPFSCGTIVVPEASKV